MDGSYNGYAVVDLDVSIEQRATTDIYYT